MLQPEAVHFPKVRFSFSVFYHAPYMLHIHCTRRMTLQKRLFSFYKNIVILPDCRQNPAQYHRCHGACVCGTRHGLMQHIAPIVVELLQKKKQQKKKNKMAQGAHNAAALCVSLRGHYTFPVYQQLCLFFTNMSNLDVLL